MASSRVRIDGRHRSLRSPHRAGVGADRASDPGCSRSDSGVEAILKQGFARCPTSADQHADVMKHLVSSAARARALADQNPLLEPDAAFYEAELAATLAALGR